MSSVINPTAFPIHGLHHDSDFNGMSLRDYFAAHCDVSQYEPLKTLERMHGTGNVTINMLASYIAEIRSIESGAMLAERAK